MRQWGKVKRGGVKAGVAEEKNETNGRNTHDHNHRIMVQRPARLEHTPLIYECPYTTTNRRIQVPRPHRTRELNNVRNHNGPAPITESTTTNQVRLELLTTLSPTRCARRVAQVALLAPKVPSISATGMPSSKNGSPPSHAEVGRVIVTSLYTGTADDANECTRESAALQSGQRMWGVVGVRQGNVTALRRLQFAMLTGEKRYAQGRRYNMDNMNRSRSDGERAGRNGVAALLTVVRRAYRRHS